MNERDLRAGEIYQWLKKTRPAMPAGMVNNISIMILEYLEQNTDARLREAEAKVERLEFMLGECGEDSELCLDDIRSIRKCEDGKWRYQFGRTIDPQGNATFWQTGWDDPLEAYTAIKKGSE